MQNEKKNVCRWPEGKNCFGIMPEKGNTCRALSDTDFPNRSKCPFYKSREQYEKELKK